MIARGRSPRSRRRSGAKAALAEFRVEDRYAAGQPNPTAATAVGAVVPGIWKAAGADRSHTLECRDTICRLDVVTPVDDDGTWMRRISSHEPLWMRLKDKRTGATRAVTDPRGKPMQTTVWLELARPHHLQPGAGRLD